MKIELKDINVSSQVANAFIAFLYINDVKAGITRNAGHDSSTAYHHIDEQGKILIAQAELYCKTLRPYSTSNVTENQQGMTLEQHINKLIEGANKRKKRLRSKPKL